MAGPSKRARLDLPRQSSMSDPEEEDESLRLTLGPPGSSRPAPSQTSSQDLRGQTSLTSGSLSVSTHPEEEERYRPRRTPVRAGASPAASSPSQCIVITFARAHFHFVKPKSRTEITLATPRAHNSLKWME